MRKPFFFKLAVLLVVIFVTRLWRLSSIPLHLTQDEAAVGYTSYSILLTGKDEWGEMMPLQFRSIGDYKQPVLIYLVSLSERVFGLNEFAVRFPTALFSSLTVLLVWWMSQRFVFAERYRSLGFLVALVLALSPWHIRPSRMSHDAIIALFFVAINLLVWLLFLEKQKLRYMVIGVMVGFLAAMSYHSTKLFIPSLNLIFVIAFREKVFGFIRSRWKDPSFWLSICFLLVMAFWVVTNFVVGRASVRGQMTFLSNDFEYQRLLKPLVSGELLAGFWQTCLLMAFWFKRYIEYLDPSFYISDGLELTLKGQFGQGVLLGMEVVVLLLGLLALGLVKWRKGIFKNEYVHKLLIAYLLLSFLPASLANNSKHSYRTSLALPVVSLLIVLGWLVLSRVFKKRWRYLFFALVLSSYVYGLTRFAEMYLIHYPVQLSEYRQYPWGEVAKHVNSIKGDYEKVVVDPRFGTQGPYAVGVPQYYFLFYDKYDPAIYQKREMANWDSSDYENFEFRGVEWAKDNKKGVLYVASPWSFMTKEGVNEEQILKKFKFMNGVDGILVVEGRK